MTSKDLLAALQPSLDEAQWDWLQQTLALSGERLMAAFVGAGRRLGATRLGSELRSDRIQGSDWTLRRAGRVAMLLSLDEREGAEAGDWIVRAFREGDSREKAAVISALPLLSQGETYLAIALDAGRTNETDLFTSLAAHNPFPAEHYSEQEFNQLVMKATFQDMDLGNIVGLGKRANAQLARMGMEYIDERLSAQRSYPPSLWLAIAPTNPPGAAARMIGELQHSQATRRGAAALGLRLSSDARALSFLEERLLSERDDETKLTIEVSIASLRENS